ncbi:MAG: hypothetical protein ACYTG3_04605 [Planctomycetota bacterium]
MTPNCPYARDCIKVVWDKRMQRVLTRKSRAPGARRRSPGRISAQG